MPTNMQWFHSCPKYHRYHLVSKSIVVSVERIKCSKLCPAKAHFTGRMIKETANVCPNLQKQKQRKHKIHPSRVSNFADFAVVVAYIIVNVLSRPEMNLSQAPGRDDLQRRLLRKSQRGKMREEEGMEQVRGIRGRVVT